MPYVKLRPIKHHFPLYVFENQSVFTNSRFVKNLLSTFLNLWHKFPFYECETFKKHFELMKTSKTMMLIVASALATTFSYAQAGLGASSSTQASVNKAVNVSGTTRAATQASTKAAAATTKTATVAGAKAAEVKATTVATAKENANANARVKAQAEVKASEQAKLKANENSAVFGTKTETQAGTDASVNVNGQSAVDKTKSTAKKTKAETVKTTGETKAKAKTEARAKSQAAAHASDKAVEHANDNSAVFGAKSETEASGNVNADRSGASVNGKGTTNTKAKGQIKKG